MEDVPIPADFPNSVAVPVLPGYQPKVGARRVNGMYVLGYTEEELRERFDACFTLVGELEAYCRRKAASNGWSLTETFRRVTLSVRSKVNAQEWGLSGAEAEWLLMELGKRLEN